MYVLLRVRDRNSQPYKTTNKITAYILAFTFLERQIRTRDSQMKGGGIFPELNLLLTSL
jgi:hypothetical protein